MRIEYDKWVEQYQPEPNFITDDAPFDGRMFETFGSDFDYVYSVIQERNSDSFVWTLAEYDGVPVIEAGARMVNRLGYFVTKYPAVGVVEVEVPA